MLGRARKSDGALAGSLDQAWRRKFAAVVRGDAPSYRMRALKHTLKAHVTDVW
jgi:hypothetical protein